MLDRLSDRRRQAASVRQRRYRARQRSGVMLVTIEVTGAILDLLVNKTHWLQERDCGDKEKIARAVERMLADSARHS